MSTYREGAVLYQPVTYTVLELKAIVVSNPAFSYTHCASLKHNNTARKDQQ